jgi:hypothetical protein
MFINYLECKIFLILGNEYTTHPETPNAHTRELVLSDRKSNWGSLRVVRNFSEQDFS